MRSPPSRGARAARGSAASLVKRPVHEVTFANPAATVHAPAFAHRAAAMQPQPQQQAVVVLQQAHAQQAVVVLQPQPQPQAPVEDVWEARSDGADTWFVHRHTGESVWEKPRAEKPGGARV